MTEIFKEYDCSAYNVVEASVSGHICEAFIDPKRNVVYITNGTGGDEVAVTFTRDQFNEFVARINAAWGRQPV